MAYHGKREMETRNDRMELMDDIVSTTTVPRDLRDSFKNALYIFT